MSENADHSVMRRKPIAAEDQPERETGQDFAAHHTPPVAEADFAERQGADDERRGLRSGVAAARDDERHEQCQDDGLRDLRLEGRPSPSRSASRRGRAPSASRRASESSARSAMSMYGSSSASDPPIRWISLVAVASATSSTSSMVTMPISMPAVSVTGSAVRSY